MSYLLEEGHHLMAEFELGVHQLRAHFAQHTFREIAMQYLDDLITSGQKLKAERADLVVDRDTQKVRADKAEAALKALQDQTTADEAKVKAALAEMSAEVVSEAGNVLAQAGQGAADGTIITNVTAPTVAGQTVLPVSQVSVTSIASAVDSASVLGGSVTVSGPGIADGSTIVAAEQGAATITLSQPTVADHSGDGSETLTVVAPAAAAPTPVDPSTAPAVAADPALAPVALEIPSAS